MNSTELAANLSAVRMRMAAACERVGRQPEEVVLVAVGKTRPIEEIEKLADLGVIDIGENRDQEARVKAAARPDLRWHFLGTIQTNKARRIGSYAHVAHAVDRDEVLGPLSRGAIDASRVLDILIQVSVDGDPRRGGASADQVLALADAADRLPGLAVRGVMAVAPLNWAPADAFDRLREVSDRLRVAYPHALAISAGMSGDFEEAIEHGSTMVRVGTAIFGVRAPDVR